VKLVHLVGFTHIKKKVECITGTLLQSDSESFRLDWTRLGCCFIGLSHCVKEIVTLDRRKELSQ